MCRRIFIKVCFVLYFCIYICNYKLYAQTGTASQEILSSLLQNGFNFDSILNSTSKNLKEIANYNHKEQLRSTIVSVFSNVCCFGFDTYDREKTLQNCRHILIEMWKLIGWRSFFYSMFSKFIRPTNYLTGGLCFNQLIFWRVYITVIIDYHYQNYIYVNYHNNKLSKIGVLLIDNKMKSSLESDSKNININNENTIKEGDNNKLNCRDYIPFKEINYRLNKSQYISLYLSFWQFCIGATFMYKPGILYLRVLWSVIISKSQQVCDFSYCKNDLWHNFVEDDMGVLRSSLTEMWRNRNSAFIDICLGLGRWEVVCSVVVGHFNTDEHSNNFFVLCDSSIDKNMDLYKQKPIYSISFYVRRIIYDSCG